MEVPLYLWKTLQLIGLNVVKNSGYQKVKAYSSISIYFRALKCVLNRAVHDGIIKESSFPFGKNKYEIPEGCGRKLALTLSEIKKVMSFQCETKDIEEFGILGCFLIYVMALILWIYYFFSIQIL